MATASGILYNQFELVALQTTVAPSYTHPVTPAEAEYGGKYHSSAIGSRSYYANYPHPATQQKIQGWKWDERAWTDENIENTIGKIPVNWDPTTSGVLDYFQSGIGSHRDLELQGLIDIPSSGIHFNRAVDTWVPEIYHGYFYDDEEEHYLFSDDSEIVYPSFSGVVEGVLWSGIEPGDAVASGFNRIELNEVPKVGIPILVRKYEWNEAETQYDIYQNWRKIAEFTGIRDEDLVRQSTYNNLSDSIYYQLVDRTSSEFLISYSGVEYSHGIRSGNPAAIFNQQCCAAVGLTTSGVLFSGLETISYTTSETTQVYHTQFSPIDRTMQTLVFTASAVPSGYLPAAVVGSGVDGEGLVGGGPIYSGLIEAGFLDIPVVEWVGRPLGTTLSGYEVSIDYDLGLLVFGGELASVPQAGQTIMAGYYHTVRLEYEPELSLDTVLACEANTNPIYAREASRFLFLSRQEEEPASIALEARLPLITTDIYGPLSIGNHYAGVVATVRDTRGEALEGESVTIEVTSTPSKGGFGSAASTTITTDTSGEAKGYYNPPRSISDIGVEILASGLTVTVAPPSYPTLGEITTLSTTNMLYRGDLNEVFLYKILVDDPSIGYLETSIDQENLETQLDEYYRTYLTEENIYGRTGVTSSGTLNYYQGNTTWEGLYRSLAGLVSPSIFQDNQGQGRRVLCAVVDSGALNPHTMGDGAWVPMQPVDIMEQGVGEYDFVFDTTIFDLPIPSGSLGVVPSGVHYGYFLVAPTAVKLQASVYSEVYHRTLYSNEIEIQLSIPDSMNGLWVIDELNTVHINELNVLLSGMVASQQKVPLGFRLRSPNLNLAAALDGVTFLDINPEYNANVWDVDEVTPLRHTVTISSII